MLLMFGHMSNLALKLFFKSNVAPNACPVAQTCSYSQWGERMGKWVFNTIDVSPVNGVTHLQIMSCVGDT